MPQIVQCVPNVSEGRRQDVITQLVNSVRNTNGVLLLDTASDHDHNRTVITFVGDLPSVHQAALALVRQAVQSIDMNEHQGGHPRIGAVDVIPLVPISDVTMDQCRQAAAELAEAIWQSCAVPTYLYGEAALTPQRQNLSKIRKGQYEGLKEAVPRGERQPDFGEPRLHPTAGATAVGARLPLIAFNVNLGTEDKAIADAIAKAVRLSSGGFRHVKAMGVTLEDRRQVQVSMNLENYVQTPIHRVFEVIKSEAARYGVPVVGSEIVGLMPQQALLDTADWYLQTEHPSAPHVLENRLRTDQE